MQSQDELSEWRTRKGHVRELLDEMMDLPFIVIVQKPDGLLKIYFRNITPAMAKDLSSDILEGLNDHTG